MPSLSPLPPIPPINSLPKLEFEGLPPTSKTSSSISVEMTHNDRTLKELVAPSLDNQPLSIIHLNLKANFELKLGTIQIREDPNKRLKKFHVMCSSMKPTSILKENIKLISFPFSLADLAKECLYYLPSGMITT
ncbi:hypothetical protein Pfo_018967 [Paulownia fortunei]|nr:hypothetical protein Pfo_018967 [Paulownia fortunei]